MKYSENDEKPHLFGVLFGLVFFIAGVFFCYGMALKPLMRGLASQNWLEQSCSIIKSQVAESRDSDGTSYRVDIAMAWRLEDRNYTGGSYNFSDAYSSGRSGKAEVIRKYPVGSHHACWLNPSEPTKAVLSRSVPSVVYFAGPFSFVFMFIGLLFILGSIGWLPEAWISRFNHSHKRVAQDALGFTELKAAQSPKQKLFGALFFAVFWNGITGVFVYQAVQSHLKGDPEWFLTLFIIPFVLVGIGAIFFVLYTLIGQFNPRPTLFISEGRPKLGQKTTLQWRFSKSTDRLSQLDIRLMGEERATYQQGTSTTTDTHEFYNQSLTSTTVQAMIASGSASVAVPEDSMHTFDSGNNEIRWFIQVHGSISKWPDIKDQYPMTVRPRS